jgi:hypothetical protein
MAAEDFVPIVDILDELRRLGHGECIWCELGINHPPYSLCPKRGGDPAVPEAAAGRGAAKAKEAGGLPWNEICRFGERNEFSVHVATTEEERLKCWHLVHQEYVAKGYARPQELEYRYSLHDALPDTVTFMVEVDHQLEGTVTVFPDSPLGLPADELYREELDGLRQAGRRPVEVGRLVIAREYTHNLSLLVGLFDVLAMHARRVMRATHLAITVNPSHAKYYERMLLCGRIGHEKAMPSVSGALAVLLSLDLEMENEMRQFVRGEREKPEYFRGGRTFYAHTCSKAEEDARVERIQRGRVGLREDFLRRYFVWVKPLIPRLPSSLQYFFEKCYPGYDLKGP